MQKILCDTCAVLSLMGIAPRKLASTSIETILATPVVCMSPVSLYKIGIKYTKGTLQLSVTPEDMWAAVIAQWNMTVIDITAADMACAYQLPMHHRDPFDRMLIAQALERQMSVVTFDRMFESYGVQVLS